MVVIVHSSRILQISYNYYISLSSPQLYTLFNPATDLETVKKLVEIAVVTCVTRL
jgi:CRISPR/Cas system-associated endonuclease Cas3-HD